MDNPTALKQARALADGILWASRSWNHAAREEEAHDIREQADQLEGK